MEDVDRFGESVAEAFTFLLTHTQAQQPVLCPLGLLWLDHASAHLWDRVDLYLRDGHRRLRSEDEMRAVIKSLALDLRQASADLQSAAATLKASGRGLAANRCYLAHLRTLQQAEALES